MYFWAPHRLVSTQSGDKWSRFAIETPSVRDVDLFVRFIEEDLAPARVNLLILRVDWNYAYQSHPELQDEHPLC